MQQIIVLTRSNRPNLEKSIHVGNALLAIFTNWSSYPHRNSFTVNSKIGFESKYSTNELNTILTNMGEFLSIDPNPCITIKIAFNNIF